MKCKNNVDGGICGEEIPQSSKFCLACGGKVAKEDDTTTKACPQCSSLITKRQKFCSGCGWRIDPAIFLAPKILCAGKDDDGNTCGAELIPGVKFCPECGSDQSKLNEQDKVAKGESESIPVERQTEVGSRVDDLTNTRRSPQQSSGSGSSSRSDSPDAWKPPGMLSSTPDSTEEDTVDSDLQRLAGGPEHEPEMSEFLDEREMAVQNEDGQGDRVRNEENTKETGSQLPASAINVLSKSPVNDLDQIPQQLEAMETDETPKSDNTMEDNNMNDQSTQPECPPQGPSLSESGNPVTSDEPMEIPVTESGLTKTETNKTEKPVTTPSVNEEIPPHSFITYSTGNAGAKNKVQQLAQTFEKNVNVRSPEKVKTQAAGSEQEQDQDVRNGNVPPESVVSENVDETGDAKPQASEDEKDWKNAPLPDSSSSDDDDDGDEEEDADKEDKGEGEEEDTKPDPSVKSKHKKKGKKRRKLEEEKKKDRKKRKEEKSKGETDGTSDMSKKQDKKEKKAKTQSKEEKDEEMKQLAANEETRAGDKDKKNQTNKSTVAEKIQKSTEFASTSTQASGQSYASVTANNATTGKGSNQKGKQFVDIYFHCIVAANLISSFERDKLFVVFEDTTLGGWKARKYQMKGLRVLKDDSVEFSGVVAMPKGQVYRRQNYNYVITHGQTETWEYVYYSGGLSGNSLYRTLNIYGKDLKKGVYHRYDGVVRDNPTKNKGLLQQFKEFFIGDEYKKILYRDAEHASLTFLPHWQLTSLSADGINGEEIVNHVNFVVDGLRETYCKLAGLWHGSVYMCG